MSTENHEGKPVIFNTPAGFNFSELFGDLSIKFKPKVEFLIHQINYYNKSGGYQINSKNHKLFFGIKSTELAEMLRRLIANGIIKLVANFAPGNTSNAYKMVTPFNVDDPTTQKSYYYPDQILFIRKWIADGFIVKSAATTKFKKEPKITHATIIAEQQKQISDLQAQVSALLGQSKGGAQSQILDDCKPVQVSGFTAPIAKTIPVENEITLSDLTAIVEDAQNVFSTQETSVSHPKVEDDQDIKELALMFGGDVSLVDNSANAPITGIPEVLRIESIMPATQSDIKDNDVGDFGSPETESYLNGGLKVHYPEDGVVIEYGQRLGILMNYDKIQVWLDRMTKLEKQRFYIQLITSNTNTVIFPLNRHTKAWFTREAVNGDLHFTYQKMSAA